MRENKTNAVRLLKPLVAAALLFLQANLRAEITPGSLQAAADYSRPRRGYAVLVMQHGKIIFEEYQNGSSAGAKRKIYSGTKSFWVTATLIAANEGMLSLDERVSDTITEWQGNPLKRGITIRQLMNFTDGLDPAFQLHGESIHDRNGYAINVPLVAKPGHAFIYGPSHGQVLCELLRRKLSARGTTPFRYLESRVLDPLGLGAVEHKEDILGNPLIATGFKLTARQWSRFGVMLLHNGSYGSRQIVPSALLDEALRGTSANPAFGMGLWLNREAGSASARQPDIENVLEKKWQQQEWARVCICRDAPSDMFAAVGSGYQRLFVIPSMDLIIVRQGENASFSDVTFLRTLLGR